MNCCFYLNNVNIYPYDVFNNPHDDNNYQHNGINYQYADKNISAYTDILI